MEESLEILVKSLADSGVAIPDGVSSMQDLTASTLLSICSDALRLINPSYSSSQHSISTSISAHFNLSSHLADAFTSLGFIGDITFHTFLYPSHEDLYKLLRFLVERLPSSTSNITNHTRLSELKHLTLESPWEAQCSVSADLPEANTKLQHLKSIQREMELVLAATKQMDEDLLKLHSDLEKQPKLSPRRSYIDRIKEITKNSRKQDIDIEQILKETRELQLQSNSIQERLHRTYAVVDETVFREAKRGPGGHQLYRLLASIHENFEQMAEKILATDRTRREAADSEAKLAAISSRSLNLDKLKADLDAIRKENELLEQHIKEI